MAIRDLHTPVLLERSVELFEPALARDGAVLVDATLGLGGHAEALLERFPSMRLVGLDRDSDALALAGERLVRFGERVTLAHTVFDGVAATLAAAGIHSVDGVLFDLGVSSLQLDRAERGFSYAHDAPLDMRMDASGSLTAAQVLAEYPEERLRSIFFEYGEEKLAARYARRIVAEREIEPFVSSARLVDVIAAATPAAVQRSGHPAKRVFQALRIEVNQELAALTAALPLAIDALALNGRIVVMSYQSLEDRIVKRFLRSMTTSTAPAGLPVELPEHLPKLRMLTRGAELAGDDEKAANPRAASVRLRAAERVRGSA